MSQYLKFLRYILATPDISMSHLSFQKHNYMSKEQITDFLSISSSTVRMYRRAIALPHVGVGGSSVDKMLKFYVNFFM